MFLIKASGLNPDAFIYVIFALLEFVSENVVVAVVSLNHYLSVAHELLQVCFWEWYIVGISSGRFCVSSKEIKIFFIP